MAIRKPLPPNIAPRCLTVDQAAEYVGMSGPSFEKAVDAGLFPKALPFAAHGIARNLWDRNALDQALDRMSGLLPQSASGPDAETGGKAQIRAFIDARKAKVRHPQG